MAFKFERKNVEMIVSTAESLKKVVEQLTQVAADMQTHGMTEAFFPWTKRQWDCLDVIVIMSNHCVTALPSQILAKTQNRPSRYELIKVKSGQRVVQRQKQKEGMLAATTAN
jgi:hypothetical protein